MKATAPWLGVLLAAVLPASPAGAQCYYPPIPQAPDMCNPGYYCTNNCGIQYGPNHCVYPCFPPFQGMVPGPPPPKGGPGGAGAGPGPGGVGAGPGGACPGYFSPSFPTHPFARSPRDYFMAYETEQAYAPTPYFPGTTPGPSAEPVPAPYTPPAPAPSTPAPLPPPVPR